MKREKNNIQFKNKYFTLLIVILIMSIGFAAVSSTLSFKGKGKISVNLEDLDCYIGNLFVNSINKFDSLSNDLSGFTFSITGKNNEIKYYIVNNSTEYDIKPTIICSDANEDGNTFLNEYDEVVAAQGIGEATITIERTNTSELNYTCQLTYELVERTSIAPKVKKIFYSADGSTLTNAYKTITMETTYGSLSTPTKGDSVFLGWIDKNDEEISDTTTITNYEDEVLYADWSMLQARYTSYDNSKGYSSCETVQCAIDELAEKLN